MEYQYRRKEKGRLPVLEMKICHMSSAHPSEDIRIFHKECISLTSYSPDIFLVARGDIYEKCKVRICGIGDIPSSRLKRMIISANKVYKTALKLDCDLYHFHDPELLPYGLILKRKGKKVIFDIHEDTINSILNKPYLPVLMAKLIARLYARYERYICKQLDALITVTPTQTDYYKRINSNTVEIRNYPIISEIQCIPRDRDTIAFAGGITHQWNHDVVIRALNSIDNAKYVLCGPANNYLNELKKINGWEKVHYLGKIQHEMVSSVLSKATIGVALLTPSSNTGGKNGTMGNTKIFEEMMAGLPVVCTNFVLWRDFIDRYQCGICVNPLSEKEVIAAFKYLLNNPEEARRMGDNGIKAIKEEYNWKIEEKKLFELYDLVLGYK